VLSPDAAGIDQRPGPSLQQDLINAGARWTDQAVVTEHHLVTAQKPDDLPQFNKAMIEMFAAG